MDEPNRQDREDVKEHLSMDPIYVDIDDVISETTRALVSILAKEFNKIVAFEDIYTFNLKESFELSDEQYEKFFQRVHEPDVILSFPPITKAIATLKRWQDKGHKIAIVTGRLPDAFESSLTWLNHHQVPYDSFMMVDKYSRPGVKASSMACSLEEFSSMKFSFAIEDSADMALYLSQTMDIPVALMSRPWNLRLKLNGKIRRFDSWHTIDDEVEKFW